MLVDDVVAGVEPVPATLAPPGGEVVAVEPSPVVAAAGSVLLTSLGALPPVLGAPPGASSVA